MGMTFDPDTSFDNVLTSPDTCAGIAAALLAHRNVVFEWSEREDEQGHQHTIFMGINPIRASRNADDEWYSPSGRQFELWVGMSPPSSLFAVFLSTAGEIPWRLVHAMLDNEDIGGFSQEVWEKFTELLNGILANLVAQNVANQFIKPHIQESSDHVLKVTLK